jgi:hypothetical protein
LLGEEEFVKKVMVFALIAGVIGAVIFAMKKSEAPGSTMWDKMRANMEAMPEDFPPRVMFDNVAATRDNTEEILRILDKHGSEPELESVEE